MPGAMAAAAQSPGGIQGNILELCAERPDVGSSAPVDLSSILISKVRLAFELTLQLRCVPLCTVWSPVAPLSLVSLAWVADTH